MEGVGQLHASAALPQEKQPPVPVECEAVWAAQGVWTFWIIEKSLVPASLQSQIQKFA
jgi:hypothetical protein